MDQVPQGLTQVKANLSRQAPWRDTCRGLPSSATELPWPWEPRFLSHFTNREIAFQ